MPLTLLYHFLVLFNFIADNLFGGLQSAVVFIKFLELAKILIALDTLFELGFFESLDACLDLVIVLKQEKYFVFELLTVA